jgi:hypothetical protein
MRRTGTPRRGRRCGRFFSGVRSAAAGGFGLVVGVDRGVGVQDLVDAGAHIVVQDLEEFVR